jgi:hypothetical protein
MLCLFVETCTVHLCRLQYKRALVDYSCSRISSLDALVVCISYADTTLLGWRAHGVSKYRFECILPLLVCLKNTAFILLQLLWFSTAPTSSLPRDLHYQLSWGPTQAAPLVFRWWVKTWGCCLLRNPLDALLIPRSKLQSQIANKCSWKLTLVDFYVFTILLLYFPNVQDYFIQIAKGPLAELVRWL